MNTIHILGRIVKKEHKVTTKAGKELNICEFLVACDRNYSAKETDFINCVAFDNSATYLEKYSIVGQRVYIVGSINIDHWQTAEGENRYNHFVRVSSIQNADKVKDDSLDKE